jgi:adenylate cyclase
MVSRTMLWVTIPKNGAGRATGELQLIFPCDDSLATLYLDLDAPEQAEQYMRKAQEICERAGIDPDALMVLPYLA